MSSHHSHLKARPDIAIFAATSGHSGVDRVIKNLLPEFADRGYGVDLLQIHGHGPHIDHVPGSVRRIVFPARHVNTALPSLIKYLHKYHPRALITDKDKVNRTAIWARALSNTKTWLAVRVGTTVSKNLENQGLWSRGSHCASMRLFYRFADAVLTPSRGAADDLARISGLGRGRITVVPSPVMGPEIERLAHEALEHPWLKDKDPPIVLGVGELSARKDFVTLLQAFAVLRRHLRCRLIILGEGRKREQLSALARQLGIAVHVDLPGFQPNPYAFMAHSDVFALTSICEGCPIALIEALALGLPAVATDCPSGPREVLQQGRIGALVNIGDYNALAAALDTTLADPPAPIELRDAVTAYSVKHSADCYLSALGLINF